MEPSTPTATLTFLFTDIEGSTRLWESHPEPMRVALARHDALLHAALAACGGDVFKTVGDAFCAAFVAAPQAVSAALRGQRDLAGEAWPASTPLKVRMALHTGSAEVRDGDYFGAAVNRVARLLATGHGGQTLLSQSTCDACRGALPEAVALRDLGLHRLKDLAQPERIWQLDGPGARAEFPPIRSLSTHANNLPQQLTSFVGRGRAIADVDALLEGHRLITLTGAGGSGKTRLGLHVAAEALVRFPDGAWFVELAPIADPALLPAAVATALGVAVTADRTVVQALVEHCRDRRLLLLLDNCEHLLDACAALADALLRQCPRLQVLATSREALGVTGERHYRVPSLSMPDRAAAPTLARLAATEAVQLFVARAQLVQPEFRLDDRNAAALASVCWRLDGIPLAIELAAARMRALSIADIDERLDQRFRLLTGGSRSALPRHRTLRALVDWSYDLLAPEEQRLLQRLAVFAGGWTLDAAEQVGADVEAGGIRLLDILESLANKNLVSFDGTAGRGRYRLLETVRQYAQEKLLESGHGDAVRQRHRDHFLALAEAAAPRLLGPEQAQWFQRLEDEHDNLRLALDWSLEGAGIGESLRLCSALQRFWATRGHFIEGAAWCARALAHPGAAPRDRERASALHAAGALAYLLGDFAAAQAAFEASLAIRESLGDRAGVAASLNNLGNVAIERGDYAAAQARHEASLAVARDAGEPWSIANSLVNLGIVAEKRADFPTARALYDECLAIRRQAGDRKGIAVALNNLASAAFAQGDDAAARTLHEEGLAIRRELGDHRGIALALGNLANLAYAQGNFAEAQAMARESLALGRDLGDRRQVGHSLGVLAGVDAARGNVPQAARLWGATERLCEALGAPPPQVGRGDPAQVVAAARLALGDDAAFERAWQEGRALSYEAAMALALEGTKTS